MFQFFFFVWLENVFVSVPPTSAASPPPHRGRPTKELVEMYRPIYKLSHLRSPEEYDQSCGAKIDIIFRWDGREREKNLTADIRLPHRPSTTGVAVRNCGLVGPVRSGQMYQSVDFECGATSTCRHKLQHAI
ncbi:UNVERIFIED_CONTAM: hypothetical protein Sindi_0872900 [Sesamum indicum]